MIVIDRLWVRKRGGGGGGGGGGGDGLGGGTVAIVRPIAVKVD